MEESSQLLNSAIVDIYKEMKAVKPDSSEYSTMVNNLRTLENIDMDKKRAKSSSASEWGRIGAYLLGIVGVMAFEYSHVITTKALPMATRFHI